MRSDAAVQCVIRQARLGQIGAIHLVTVQPRLGSYMGRFLKAALIRDYQREQGAKALTRAKRLLDEAGVAPAHIYTGDIVEIIVRAAKESGVDEITERQSRHRRQPRSPSACRPRATPGDGPVSTVNDPPPTWRSKRLPRPGSRADALNRPRAPRRPTSRPISLTAPS
jgi:hypothetical protein